MKYFNTNNFPSRSEKIWEDMSKDLNGRWKPHSVYTHVRENKNGNLDTARKNLGLNIQPPSRSVIKDDIIEDDINDGLVDARF